MAPPLARALRRASLALVLCGGAVFAQESGKLAAFSAMAGSAPPPAWRFVGISNLLPTRFDLVDLDGRHVLRVQVDKSYGNLIHAWQGPARTLRFSWRLDQPLAQANIRVKEGDDAALKVCLMFDLPLEKLPLGERNLMRLARAFSSEPLPAATLCYLWDPALPVDTLLPNAYTQRVRFLVLGSGTATLGQWAGHQRDIAADFKRAFGHESDTVPPLVAVAIGADGDSTAGTSLGYIGDVAVDR